MSKQSIHNVVNMSKIPNDLVPEIEQTITADYTGVFSFCGVLLILGILTIMVWYKISPAKKRLDILEEKVNNLECNINNKLDKLLEKAGIDV